MYNVFVVLLDYSGDVGHSVLNGNLNKAVWEALQVLVE